MELRNTISLSDQMTPVLRSVTRAMESTLNLMQELDAHANTGVNSESFRQAESHIKRANSQLAVQDRRLRDIGKTAREGAGQAERMQTAFSGMPSNLSMRLHGLSHALLMARMLKRTLSEISDTADKAIGSVARIGYYNETPFTDEQIYGTVYLSALSSDTALEETADLINRINISGVLQPTMDTSTIEGEMQAMSQTFGAVELASYINKALASGGSTQAENNRALIQLGQAMSMGELKGQELRSVLEQAPMLADVIARGLGNVDSQFEGVTIGDLKGLGAAGELSMDRVIPAIMSMADEIDDMFDAMPKTVGKAMTNMGSHWNYFMSLLYQSGGPLDRIASKIYKLGDALTITQDSDALGFWQSMSNVFGFFATAVERGVDAVVSAFNWMNENAMIVNSVLTALGLAAAAAALIVFGGFLLANAPIIILIGLLSAVIYGVQLLGVTIGQVVGGVIGAVLFGIYLIWNILIAVAAVIVMLVMGIWNILVWVITGIVLAIMGAIQIVLWAVALVGTIVIVLATVLYTVFQGIIIVIKGAVLGVLELIFGFIQVLLGALQGLAGIIDKIFGSNLAGSVEGWVNTVDATHRKIQHKVDLEGNIDNVKDAWANSGEMISDLWYETSAPSRNMAGVIDFAQDTAFDSGDFTGVDDMARGLMKSPVSGWDQGMQIGTDFVDDITKFQLDPDSALGFGDMTGLANPTGGDLDSIGRIKSDVDISDESIKLLRDISARDYLLQLKIETPAPQIKFGDIRETADAQEVLYEIEDMLEARAAVNLNSRG